MEERRDHILVEFTRKFHPNISGEVIEYSWGFAKDYYIWLSLYKNEGKKTPKKCPRGHIKRQPYHKSGLYVL